MKTTLNLTRKESMEVLDALVNTAIEYDWGVGELDQCGIIKEYTTAVCAALDAMGIEINIDYEPSDEAEYEDEDEDEDEGVYTLTPKGAFVARFIEAGHTFDEAMIVANVLFDTEKDE